MTEEMAKREQAAALGRVLDFHGPPRGRATYAAHGQAIIASLGTHLGEGWEAASVASLAARLESHRDTCLQCRGAWHRQRRRRRSGRRG